MKTPRRLPTQERAQLTIDTLFATTAQIVEEHGFLSLTTNKIAAKAGYSIGTLYQYFPTKEAIVQAMMERERDRQMARLAEVLTAAEAAQLPVQAVIRTFIAALVDAFGAGWGNNKAARRAMIRLGWEMDHRVQAMAGQAAKASPRTAQKTATKKSSPTGDSPAFAPHAGAIDALGAATQVVRAVSEQVAVYLAQASVHLAAAGGAPLRTSPAAMFVVTRGVMGVIRSASLEKSPLLGSDAFVDEITHMVWQAIQA